MLAWTSPTNTTRPPCAAKLNDRAIESGLPVASKTAVGRSAPIHSRSSRTGSSSFSTMWSTRKCSAANRRRASLRSSRADARSGEIRELQHGKPDRPGADDQHRFVPFERGAGHRVRADAEGLDEVRADPCPTSRIGGASPRERRCALAARRRRGRRAPGETHNNSFGRGGTGHSPRTRG